jgi:hypothetical protein
VNNDEDRESSSAQPASVSEDTVKNSTDEDVENESNLTKNTRKELAELDDLDI